MTQPAADAAPKPPAPAPAPAADDDGALSDQHLAFLDREAEHFFQGEMAHERRASWLLALASGLLLELSRLASSDYVDTISRPSLIFLMFTLGALVLSVALALWALWPLGGGVRPSLLRPWRRASSWDEPGTMPPIPARFRASATALTWGHYVSHRRRAAVKGRRVVWITLTMAFALACSCASFALA
ncbi:MAG: hypothetical protein Tsb0020_24000 [Haliangiales bacterium]